MPPPNGRPGKPFADAVLDDGTPVRVTRMTFAARQDTDEDDHGAGRPAERMTLVLAHGRRGEYGPLNALLAGLIATAAVMAVGIIAVVT